MNISTIFDDWTGSNSGPFGIADDLRCVAMVCIDDAPHITRAEYITEATARGFNPSTASRCWSFVKKQGV